MRTSNGSGQLYFDDLFSDGIPDESALFYSFNSMISVFTLLLTPVLFYVTCIQSSQHKNLRLLYANIYLSFYFCAFGNLMYSILVIARVSERHYQWLYVAFIDIASFGPANWRMTFLTIAIERTVATFHYKTYETKGSLYLAIGLFIVGLSGMLIPITFYNFGFHVAIPVVIIMVIDIVGIISTIILYCNNKRLKKLTFDAEIMLTWRYQIYENIQVLQVMTPIIAIGSIFDFTSIAVYSLQSWIDFETQLRYPFYYLITNLYAFVAFFIYVKTDVKTRKKIWELFCKKISQIEPLNMERSSRLTDMSRRQNEHFEMLKQLWK